MNPRTRGIARANAIVAAVIAAALVFSLYLGYLEWANGTFPAQEKPFADYATVTSTVFNGTVLYYTVQWNASGDFLPLYAQITSDTTDEANSPVCNIGVSSIARGQVLDLPFAIAAPKESIASVDLNIAVRASSNMSQFTIVHHLDSINAVPGDIPGTNYACEEPAGADMAIR